MTEAELRDLLATNIQVLEPGLLLLQKEQYIPHTLGTRSFIDLYAKDGGGHHVLVELKRSNAASREALHEVHKYVEAVKQHFGARDDEIRVFVASTEWQELLVPFSRLAADSNLALVGLQLHVDETSGTITASRVPLLPMSQGRFIAPWHDVNWYLDHAGLERGIESIDASCRAKGIEDYVIVVLRPPQPVHSEHQAGMRAMIQGMAEMSGLAPAQPVPELPLFRYIAYFAMQALSPERYLRIIERDAAQLEEARELMDQMEAEEALHYLHEAATGLEPRPEQEHYEIGYPAKFSKFLDAYGCEVEAVHRRGVFARNVVLDDRAILSELRGEAGSTGQRFKRTVSVANPAHMTSLRSDITSCLDENPVWRNHILRAVDEIQRELPDAEVDVSIFNPGTGLLTVYFATSRDDGVLYIPTYSMLVRAPEPVRMYYGGLQGDGTPLSIRRLLDKYYEGDLGTLLLAFSWGGRDSRDSDIIEDLGLAYRSFRCDGDGDQRTFYQLRDEKWRPCPPVDVFSLFGEYVETNESFVRQVVGKIQPRDMDGMFDASSAELLLGDQADVERGRQLRETFAGAPDECDICGCPLSEEKYMVDGSIPAAGGAWGCMCGDCSLFYGKGVGWGMGQLYLREGDEWLLVGGFPPGDDEDEFAEDELGDDDDFEDEDELADDDDFEDEDELADDDDDGRYVKEDEIDFS